MEVYALEVCGSVPRSCRSSQTTRIFTATRHAVDTQRDIDASIQSRAYQEYEVLHIILVSNSALYGRCTYGRRDVIRPIAKLHSRLHPGGNNRTLPRYESCYDRSDGTVNESRNVLFIVNANEMKVGLAN